MGLVLTSTLHEHRDSPSWSYTGFNAFRTRLSFEAGINLRQMDGFGGSVPWAIDDAIVPLLNHSDCDGVLTPAECAMVAPRLRELISRWGEDDYDRQTGEQLADMMAECAAGGVDLEFC